MKLIDKVIDKLVGKTTARAAMCFCGYNAACTSHNGNEHSCYDSWGDLVYQHCGCF
ncbi:hypothetical protein AB0I28_35825 [Phytomonospora sp. NPDC050363]|uniref:hypothetical protein n=1 Tax=Phytomonospora sp. NPDC050363 TaxID=3155642 RepID=UPI0034102964